MKVSFLFSLRAYLSNALLTFGMAAMPNCPYKEELQYRMRSLKEEALSQYEKKEKQKAKPTI